MRRQYLQLGLTILAALMLCLAFQISFAENINITVGWDKNIVVVGKPLTVSWVYGDEYEPIQRQEVTMYGWKDDGSLQRLVYTDDKESNTLTCSKVSGTSVSVTIWFVDADGFSHSYHSDSIPTQGQSGGNAEVICTFSKAVAEYGDPLTVSWEFRGVNEPLRSQEVKIHGWKGNAITTLASSDDTDARTLSCKNVKGISVSLVIWYEDGDGFLHDFYSPHIPVDGFVGETEYCVVFSADYVPVAGGPFSTAWSITGIKKPLKWQEVRLYGWKEDSGIIQLAFLNDTVANSISCDNVQGKKTSISMTIIDADDFQYSIHSQDFPVVNPEFSSLEYMNALELPSSLKKIEDYAFSGTMSQAVVIPQGCTSIGQYAFSDCPYLMYVKIPSSVKSYPSTTFSGCNENMVIDWDK